MWTSYAQNFEDLMLMRALGHLETGVYVDVGAQDPERDSVSLAFYEKGWRGVHVEPSPEYADRLQQARPDERVIRAVARDGRDPMMFYVITGSGLSTGDPEIAARHIQAGYPVAAHLVESLPLSEILDSVPGGVVHWLKIDVEGMERPVLDSWSASPVRPWVVVIESTRPNTTETTHHLWEEVIVGLGYAFVYFDGLNRFYLHADQAALKPAFDLPPNLFDQVFVTQFSPFAGVLNARLGEAATQLHKAERDRDAELQVRQQLEESLRKQEQTVQSLLEALAEAAQRTADGEHALAEAARRAAEGEQALAAVKASHSWQVTAPLRGLSRAVSTLVARAGPARTRTGRAAAQTHPSALPFGVLPAPAAFPVADPGRGASRADRADRSSPLRHPIE